MRSSSRRISVLLATSPSGQSALLRIEEKRHCDTLFISHRLTGWNAVKSRVEQLGLTLTDDEVWIFRRYEVP